MTFCIAAAASLICWSETAAFGPGAAVDVGGDCASAPAAKGGSSPAASKAAANRDTFIRMETLLFSQAESTPGPHTTAGLSADGGATAGAGSGSGFFPAAEKPVARAGRTGAGDRADGAGEGFVSASRTRPPGSVP